MATTRKYVIVQYGIWTAVLLLLSFKIPANFFSDILFNAKVTVDHWDVLQILLGFYTADQTYPQSYLDLTDNTQLIIPLLFQCLGILSMIRFLLYPLSFHTFIRTRARTSLEYYLFFLRRSFLDGITYVLALSSALGLTLHFTSITAETSSFHYQEGNLFLMLVLYSMMFFLMMLTICLFVFIGYLKKKSLPFLLFSISLLFLINKVDRVLPINLILFDTRYYFLDSMFFWGGLLLIEVAFLRRVNFIQEEYND